jgi:hypothetical protein
MGESPHSVLGIGQGSTKEQIKSAFHRHAKHWHPDMCALTFLVWDWVQRTACVAGPRRQFLQQLVNLDHLTLV